MEIKAADFDVVSGDSEMPDTIVDSNSETPGVCNMQINLSGDSKAVSNVDMESDFDQSN